MDLPAARLLCLACAAAVPLALHWPLRDTDAPLPSCSLAGQRAASLLQIGIGHQRTAGLQPADSTQTVGPSPPSADNLSDITALLQRATQAPFFQGSLLNAAAASGAEQSVGIYVYKPPSHLRAALELDKRAGRDYFMLETELLRAVATSGHLVNDPKQADFFWVPHTMIAHWIDAQDEQAALAEYWSTALRPFLEHIVRDLPYFNASGGFDHIFVYAMDSGPICEVDHGSDTFANDPVFHATVHRMIHVGYHGNDDPVEQDGRRSRFRETCYEAGFDITMPQYNEFHQRASSRAVTEAEGHLARCTASAASCHAWARFLATRASMWQDDLYFRGEIIPGRCSPGIRPWIQEYFTDGRCSTCGGRGMGSGVFALAPAGWACWSSRFFDAVDSAVIPVILADGVVEPFESFLDYRRFTAKIMTDELLRHDGDPMLDELHVHAQSFRRACGGDLDGARAAACIGHPVSLTIASLMAVRPWFSFDPNANMSAVKALVLELGARKRREFSGGSRISRMTYSLYWAAPLASQ